MRPQGFNLGMNQGRAGGAGIADHVHMHLRAALGGRHELHAGARRRAGDAPAPGRDLPPPRGRLRGVTIDPRVFKAYDVRGLYPEEVDEEGAERIGAAFIALTGAKRIAVGHDVRLSSPSVAARFAEGALAAGADVIELGLCATEMLYFAVADGRPRRRRLHHREPQPAAVHGHEDGHGRRAAALGRRGHRRGGPHRPRRPAARGRARQAQPRRRPAGALRDLVPGLRRPRRPSATCAWSWTPPTGWRASTCRPCSIACRSTRCRTSSTSTGASPTTSPTRCCPRTASSSSARSARTAADLGIAFDGDADRCFFIDDTGEFVAGDFLTALLATPPAGARRAPPPSSTTCAPRGRCGTPSRPRAAPPTCTGWATPSSRRRMREVDALFAGEVSGHYYFRDFSLRRHRPDPGAAGAWRWSPPAGCRCRR